MLDEKRSPTLFACATLVELCRSWRSDWAVLASTATVARVNLIRAFSEDQDMVAVSGTIEVEAIEPLELRLNFLFEDEDGDQIRIFSDAFNDRRVNVEICSR